MKVCFQLLASLSSIDLLSSPLASNFTVIDSVAFPTHLLVTVKLPGILQVPHTSHGGSTNTLLEILASGLSLKINLASFGTL